MTPRRADREGTIGKRADGRFYGSVQFDGKRQWVYGKARKEVSDKLKALQRKYEQGVSFDGERTPLSEFLDRWLEDVVKQRNKPKTYAGYKQIVEDHLKPTLGKIPLGDLRPDRVQALVNALSNAGKAPRTVRNIRAALRRALNQAVRWRLVSYNAAALVETPRIEQFRVEPLSREEARAFLEVIKGHPRETLYLMALLLGLREGELLGLLIENLDLEAGIVSVEGTLQWVEGRLTRTTTKSRASTRKLPLPPSLKQMLRDHLSHQQARFPENKYLFASTVGTPINCCNLLKQFKGLLKKADLRQMRFHDLRHSCATFLIARGEHPRTVMDILGHSQISTTMNTYGHVLDDVRTSAISGLDELLTS